MRNTGKITGVAIVVAAIAVGGLLVASPAQAQQARYQIVQPPNPHIAPPHQPRLGLYGHMEYGRGMVVDHVPWGTPASRTGLEPGDAIVRVNGRWIQSDYDYFQALRFSGATVRLLVRDVRGRGLIPVTVYLYGGGSGPILYRNQRP